MLLGIPVQQFISCFYTVPMQFGYFSLHEAKTKTEELEEGLLPDSAKTADAEELEAATPTEAIAEGEAAATAGDDDK